MATAGQKNTRPPAEVPVDTGKHMRACLRCKLLKTVEQVSTLPGGSAPRAMPTFSSVFGRSVYGGRGTRSVVEQPYVETPVCC